MLKKVAKTLDEMAKNEELMAGILAAAEGGDMVGEGEVEENGERLRTIGEEEGSKGKKDEEGYDEEGFDQNRGEEDDYAF